jgi:hypothetical protein
MPAVQRPEAEGLEGGHLGRSPFPRHLADAPGNRSAGGRDRRRPRIGDAGGITGMPGSAGRVERLPESALSRNITASNLGPALTRSTEPPPQSPSGGGPRRPERLFLVLQGLVSSYIVAEFMKYSSYISEEGMAR